MKEPVTQYTQSIKVAPTNRRAEAAFWARVVKIGTEQRERRNRKIEAFCREVFEAQR